MERIHALYRGTTIVAFLHVDDEDALARARKLYADTDMKIGDLSWASKAEALAATVNEPKGADW
jgi:hypothetical protein